MQLHSAAMAPPRRLPAAHGSAVVPPGHDAPGFQRPGRSCVAPRAAVDRPDASEPSKSVQPEEVQQPSTGTAAARQDQGRQDEAPAGASSSGPVQADGDGSDGIEPGDLDDLMVMLQHGLELGGAPRRPPLLSSFDLEGVADLISSGRVSRIVVMCGAGISVSAGIPDFRTPGTGLYSQLERFGLPEPEAVFSISFFKKNPKPFHMLARELFPGNYSPTPTHHFLRLLHDKGLLLRCFTQNIDSLERQAGLPTSVVVAAHGNFDSAHCIRCGREHSLDHVKAAVFADDICHCTSCSGLVKPDIVFFGEQLPDRFYDAMASDLPAAELLLVMGTSLVVQPFASLIDAVPDTCPRVLINRERVGEGMDIGGMARLLGLPGCGGGGGGFVFEPRHGCYRDVLALGDADDAVQRLASLLGWEQELEELIAAGSSSSGSSNSNSNSRAGDPDSSSRVGEANGGSSSSSNSRAGDPDNSEREPGAL